MFTPHLSQSGPSSDAKDRRGVRGRSLRALAVGAACTAAAALAATGVTTATAPSAGAATSSCTLSAKLVPSCGRLWGAAPAAYDYSASDQTQIKHFESLAGRPMDIWHTYRKNNALFPTAADKEVAANAGGRQRLLLVNWKPATDQTWAKTAAGGADARIDRLASYIKANYNKPFFIAVWHEPEHSVNERAGSGMTATDYRAMVRHVILRMKADGVSNAVFVQIFQGFPKYAVQPWWPQMYPGDDVIDWLAEDSYSPSSTNFANMLNRTKNQWKGFYNWATTQHPGKPLMLAEWGVFASSTDPGRQANFYNDVRTHLAQYPAMKAMVYFNSLGMPERPGTTRIDYNSSSLSAYRQLSGSFPMVQNP